MPMCSDGVHDMFMNNTWNFTAYEEGCMKSFGVRPDPYHVERMYGGKDISSHSNIIFRYAPIIHVQFLPIADPCI